jgi:hypothetical protein
LALASNLQKPLEVKHGIANQYGFKLPKKPPERRAKRRSRFGCRNCKLRKLKVGVDICVPQKYRSADRVFECDEGKPQCKRCTSFRILCNFAPNIPDLQPIADDSVRSLVIQMGQKFNLLLLVLCGHLTHFASTSWMQGVKTWWPGIWDEVLLLQMTPIW